MACPLQARYCAIALMPEPIIPAKCSDEKFRPSIDTGKHSLRRVAEKRDNVGDFHANAAVQ
jgi:hypothetical protein